MATESQTSGIAQGAGRAFALLFAINLFNYIDRQILSATLPIISLDASLFRSDDPYEGLKLGALTTAFMVTYMLFSPVFGRLADRVSRWVIVGIAVLVWSLATGGTGLASGYFIMLLTRCFVGIGEAAYGPVAPTILSDLYPVDHRGRILSRFYLAIPVGSALGFVIGSQIADTALGWRGAFQVVVLPGIFLGILCFFMKDRKRMQVVDSPPSEKTTYWSVVKKLRSNRSYVLCCAGMTASTFVLGGLAAWMQLYIFEREARFVLDLTAIQNVEAKQRSDGSPIVPLAVIEKLKVTAGPEKMTVAETKAKLQTILTEDELQQSSNAIFETSTAPGSLKNGPIGLYFGAITVVSGLLATILGGILGDWLRNRGVKGAYFLVAGWGTIVGFPCFVASLYLPFPYAWVGLFFAIFALFFNTGPANAIIANVTSSKMRANAFAVNILIIHALGDAISPPIIGLIKNLSGGLHVAFLLVSFLLPVAGLLWIRGASYLDADTKMAESNNE